MTRLRLGRRSAPAILAATAVLAAAALPASAVVPPTNCGNVEVKDKRFNIKADQLRCKKARKYAVRYLKRNERPRGYECESYGSGTSIEFRCSKGIKVFFAIRR